MPLPTHQNIIQAAEKIQGIVHQTPVLTSSSLNKMLQAKFFFKCENLQKTGSFKFRGATHAVLQLSKEQLAKGVATHSSGNHGAALALAAKNQGVPAYVVMPKNSVASKKDAVASYGAEIIFCEATQAAREKTLQAVVEKTGATYIPPYDHHDVIAGQGTAALELINEIPDLNMLITPTGGGGLLAGTALAANGLIDVYGAEPENSNDAYLSFQTGARAAISSINTIADGLRAHIGKKTFAVIKNNVKNIITVSEENIIQAMKLVWQRMNIIIEPSSAVAIAPFLSNHEFMGKKIGIVMTGGNVDLNNLPW